MSCGMTPEIMGPQIDSRQFARLFHHHPGSIVCNWENPLLRLNTLIRIIFTKSVRYLLGNVYYFGFPTTFGIREQQEYKWRLVK